MIHIERTKTALEYEKALEYLKPVLADINRRLSRESERDVIDSVTSRVKTSASIEKKLKKKGYKPTLENAEEHLNDIAGMRAVCLYIDDLYRIRKALVKERSIRIVKEKDFIDRPKKSGYRSLHLILEVPICYERGEKMVRVELQLRTMIMHLWARIDHRNCYKKDAKQGDAVSKTLRLCAKLGDRLDEEMMHARRQMFVE